MNRSSADDSDDKGLQLPRLSRRTFIFLGATLSVAFMLRAVFRSMHPGLKALIDTIIPADEFGPAASETGAVEAVLIGLADKTGRSLEARFLMAWLDVRCLGSFSTAPPNVRDELVAELQSAGDQTWQSRIYYFVRSTTMLHYYGNATRARALGFVGPPQPEGFSKPGEPWEGPGNG